MFEVKNITKHFGGVCAVNHISLKAESGEVTSFIGPNGSGKSTLVDLITGMIPKDEGILIVGNRTYEKWQAYVVAGLGITRTFQEIRLWNQMTVFDNVRIAFTERGVIKALWETNKKEHKDRIRELLEKVNLWEKKNQLAVNLSYGQRKLLEVIRALATDSKVYLFDEPFAGLFPEMVKTVSKIIRELKEKKKIVVLIEHNMNLIRELSGYVYVLDSGNILAEGKPNEVLAKREVIEAYLGE